MNEMVDVDEMTGWLGREQAGGCWAGSAGSAVTEPTFQFL
jgi:hypothetical protein